MKYDADIDAMKLSDVEKNGIQVFRNYCKGIEQKQQLDLTEEINKLPLHEDGLIRLNEIILNEDPRMITVVVCAFMDEQLHDMYKRELPNGIPGGRTNLLEGFGPLSRFAQRIQMAFAFNLLSADLLNEAYLLRKMRNDVSHKWDIEDLKIKLGDFIKTKMSPVENQLDDGITLPKEFYKKLDVFELFRVRLIWITARFYYESWTYPRVIRAKLDPMKVLYSRSAPKFMGILASLCIQTTIQVIKNSKSSA